MKKIEYSTLDLIEDLKTDILIYSKKSCQIFPKRQLKISDHQILDSELSYLLKGNKGFIKNIKARINRENHPDYNPEYIFSRELLIEFKDSLLNVFGNKISKSIKRIEKYEKTNKNIKEYSKQQYTIRHPRFFDKIDIIEKYYWFGFLCADGYIYKKSYKIGIEVSIKDKTHTEKFAEVIGFDKSRISQRSRFMKYKKKTREYQLVRIEFSCKPMVEDLENSGFFSSKTIQKSIPRVVKAALSKAKEEDEENWYHLQQGKNAFAWLLGFYDGDGTFRGNKRSIIYSSNKELLENIKNLYDIEPFVQTVHEPKENVLVMGNLVRKTKGLYSLEIGVTLFDVFINSYQNSMPRKRP